jgi:ABC-type antimicrobial peptide transport system permease subunit
MLPLGYFTIKDLLHDRWRSLLTIISLAVVVAGYLLLASLSRAFQTVGSQSHLTGNLVVISTDAIDPMESSLEEEVLQNLHSLAPDQIERTFPTLFQHMNIDGRIVQVRAVPLEEMPASLGLILLAGNWPSAAHQVVVDEEVARSAGWVFGSTVNIYGTDFQVSGLVRASENNLGAIWMTYPEGQDLFGTEHGFQVGYLALIPSADPESVRTLLQSQADISARYTVYLENAISENYNQINHNMVTISSVMAVISLLAITFGIYNSTSLSLTERSREIGLLQLIGFTQGKLRSFLFFRALLLTLAAYGLGLALVGFYSYYHNIHSPISFLEAPLLLSLPVSTSLPGLGLATTFALLGVWLTTVRFVAVNPLTRDN